MRKTRSYSTTRRAVGVVLAGAAVVSCLTFAALLYARLISANRHVSGSARTVVTLGVLAALTLMLLRALSWSDRARTQLACACVTTGLLAYGSETYLMVAGGRAGHQLQPWHSVDVTTADAATKQEIRKLAQESGVRFDIRSMAEVVASRRARGEDVVIRVSPNEFLVARPDGSLRSTITLNGKEVLPLGRAGNRVTVWCNESGNYVLYRSDERGFRNPGGMWTTPRIEIGVVGNSFALGGCVEEGFVDKIRSHHPATLNLGMGSTGPAMQLATLKEYLGMVRPRIVLWIYEEDDDLPALKAERQSPLLVRYLRTKDFTQGLASMQADLDRAITQFGEEKLQRELHAAGPPGAGEQIRGLVSHARLPFLRATLWPSLRAADRSVDVSDLALLGEVLREARSTVVGWQGTMYFVYLPSFTRYAGDVSPAGKARAAVLDVVAQLGIPVIDIDTVFRRHPDPLALFPFRHFVHYGEKGHDLVAKEVLRSLTDNDTGLLPRNSRNSPPIDITNQPLNHHE
jgi:hypothetical protein